jgi:hypothetical protein
MGASALGTDYARELVLAKRRLATREGMIDNPVHPDRS